MKQFEKVPLSKLVFFQEGPGLRSWQWTPDGMKVINVTNILGDAAGTVDIFNTDKYISLMEFEKQYSHFAIQNGDIVVASSGNTYGKVGIIDESCLPLMMNTSVIRFHPIDEAILSSAYLYAFLRSDHFLNQIEQFVIGGAQPNFGPTHLKKMWIILPDKKTQKKLSSIVTAYDELLIVNRRRIALLEESVRLLYKEWFVDLRFPGHESAKIVDGLPEGWSMRPLLEVGPLNYGKALKEGDRTPGSVPVYGSSGIIGKNEKPYIDGPVIIVGRKGNVGSVFWSAQSCWPIDTVYYIDQEHSSLFLFYSLKRIVFQSSDVAVPGLNRDYAHSRLIIQPKELIMNMFDDHVSIIHNQIDNILNYNKTIARARDLLLPKLMSGEIEV